MRADEVQCRRWCAAASGQLSGSWAQIWLRHGACPILPSEPAGMSHNQLPPPRQCREWSDGDHDGWVLEFVQQFQELWNLWVSLCVRRRQLMCDRSWTRVWHWNTCVRLEFWSPKPCWIILRVSVALFPRLAQNLMHTRCSILWSIVKIATGHVHDSRQTRVKTAHVILPTWNFAHWLDKHGSATIYRCFALPQLLYRWRHQYGKFWMNPCIV